AIEAPDAANSRLIVRTNPPMLAVSVSPCSILRAVIISSCMIIFPSSELHLSVPYPERSAMGMVDSGNKLCETHIVDAACQESFLPMQHPGCSPLRSAGISLGGISRLS